MNLRLVFPRAFGELAPLQNHLFETKFARSLRMSEIIRTTFVTAAAIAVTLGSAMNARAQSTAMIGLSGGAAVPMGELSDDRSTGFNGTVSLGFGAIDTPISLRFDGGYTRFGARSTTTVNVPAFRILSGSINLLVGYTGEMLRPYILGGGGFFSLKEMKDSATAQNEFGLIGGAGIAFDLSGFNTFIEARVNHIFTENSATRFAPITFGIMF